MKNNVFKIVKMGLLITMIASAFVFSGCSGDKNKVVEKPKPVETFIEASGKVKANKAKNITLDFGAKVSKINVREGQNVKMNEVLMEMDISDLNEKITDTENQLKIERLQLEKIKNGSGSNLKEQNKTILTIRNSLETAQLELAVLEEQYSKKKREVDNGTDPDISKLENRVEIVSSELKRAEDDYNSATDKYADLSISFEELKSLQRLFEDKKKQSVDASLSLQNGKNAAKNDLDRLATSISQKKSQIQNFQVDLNSTKWQSDKDVAISIQKIGSIESSLANLKGKLNKSYLKGNQVISELNNAIVNTIKPKEGDVLQSGMLLLELIDMDSLFIEAEVSEDFIKDLKLGADVEVLPVADISKKYKGKVMKISDIGREQNGDTIFIVEVSVDNSDKFLKTGFNIDLKISKK